MNKNKVLISVIVPCYNQAQYLDECLQSVENQIFTDWECLIVDDGSPDNTAEIAKKWANRNNRFRYLKKENGGLGSARNFGIENALGEWILPLDADDKISENYMQLAVNEFDNNYKVIYCEAKRFGKKQGLWKMPNFSLNTLAKRNVIFCTAFFRKNEWQKVGGYDINLLNGWEDWEFWIALLKNGGKVLKINEVCFFYRIKKQSMITDLMQKKELNLHTFDYIRSKHNIFFAKITKKIFFVVKSLSPEYQAEMPTYEFINELLAQNYEIGIITTKKEKNEIDFSEKVTIFYLFSEKELFLAKIKPILQRRIRKLYKKEFPDTILTVGKQYFSKAKLGSLYCKL
ncbi:MAG: glycosyltransferase [Prevotellaceae bacterium]|jgi:glycosyltransferase involved in cell wall biosynthesis|nr:glycosyltransferase [Prevotellaceae bacterium]